MRRTGSPYNFDMGILPMPFMGVDNELVLDLCEIIYMRENDHGLPVGLQELFDRVMEGIS